MEEQFENEEETKLEDETVSNLSAEDRIKRVAEKAAGKSTATVKHFDKENSTLFIK